MELDQARFQRAIRERTGLDDQQAATAVTTTFEAIGRALPPGSIAAVAAMLPSMLAEHLRRGSATPSVGGFLVDLAAHEHVSLGSAKEHAQVILEQLAGLFDDEPRRDLVAQLEVHVPEAAQWLVPYEPPTQRRPQFAASDDRSLAGGRPGSRNPLAEAAPDPGQRDSPAMTTDPHAETRLSSTHGISTERGGTTIARGRPGSSRPVGEPREP